MTRQPDTAKAIIQAIERSDRRSSLFWWMVEHHDEIKAASAGQRISWKTFCARAAAEGLTDTRGSVPKERNARETWRVARRFVAATARSAQADSLPPRRRPVHPARISPDWRPEEIPQPPASATLGTALIPAPAQPATQAVVPARPPGSTPLSPFADTRTKEEREAHVREQKARLDAALKEHDRRRYGSFGGGG